MSPAIAACPQCRVLGPHLPGVRRFAAAHACRSGLPEESVGDLVIAVNEVATNGVRHGSRVAELRMWRSGGHLVAEVHDEGHWIPSVPAGSARVLWIHRSGTADAEVRRRGRGTRR